MIVSFPENGELGDTQKDIQNVEEGITVLGSF